MKRRKANRPNLIAAVSDSTMPADVRRLNDVLMEQDEARFLADPDLRSFVRPYCPGEYWPNTWPDGKEPDLTLVTRIAPGVRQRQFIFDAVVVPMGPGAN